jgi:hypothetical protein
MNIKNFVFVFVFSITTGCRPSSDTTSSNGPLKQNAVAGPDISRVNIPAREHGYSKLKNKVINASKELNEYLLMIQQQSAWNNKAEFIRVLQNTEINFDSDNILIYCHTESSGSTIVALSKPFWEKQNAAIHIFRTVPWVGTTDMAYYAYGFRVDKLIPKVIL